MTDQITVLSSMATRRLLADLAVPYERQTGHRISLQAIGGVEAARRIRAGEPADVIVLASNVMEELEAEGHIVPASRLGFVRSGIAMAVPAGAWRPRIEDAESLRRAILDAPRICYSTGPSGDHLVRLWEQWQLGERVSQRAIQAPPGVPVAALLARREADLGFQQLSELRNTPGIEIVGPLPEEVQVLTVFSAGVSTTSSQREAACAVVTFLCSPEAEAAKRQHGMEPG